MCTNQYSLGNLGPGYVVLRSADAPEGQGAGRCLMWLRGGLLASVSGSALCWYRLSLRLTMCNVSVPCDRHRAVLEGLSACSKDCAALPKLP